MQHQQSLHATPPRPLPTLSWAAGEPGVLDRTLGPRIERLFGRDRVAPIYKAWATQVLPTEANAFMHYLDMAGRGMTLASGTLANLAAHRGPILAVFNHPYGLWDGCIAAAIMERFARPFAFVGHEGYAVGMPEVSHLVIPVSWDKTKAAGQMNLRARDTARRRILAGDAIGIFPGGHVAEAPRGMGRAIEMEWQPLVGRLVLDTEAAVLPVFIDGQMSRPAQVAKALHPTLGKLSQVLDYYNQFGRPCSVHIGDIVPFGDLAARDRNGLTAELRERTLDLGRAAGAYPPRPA